MEYNEVTYNINNFYLGSKSYNNLGKRLFFVKKFKLG